MQVPVSVPQEFLDRHGLVRVVSRPAPGAPRTVAALVDDAADRFGHALALADRRSSFDFVALRDTVDRAADVLASAGARPLDRVAMCLPNTVDVVVGFLATMRLGAVWVGVNTHLAPPEQQFLLVDSGASVLVTTAARAGAMATPGSKIVIVDTDSPGAWWASGRSDRRAVGHIDADAPAAIAYTSGTTGRPKGAVHSQHNMLLPPAALASLEPDRLVQGTILPLTILNIQVLSTVHSLLTGGVLVPIDRIDAGGVSEWVAEFGVQRMYATPPTVYDLLTRPDIDPSAIASLWHLGVGGAKCPEGMRERYRERFGRDFVFGYGLTEAPTGVTGPAADGRTGPIGSSGVSRPHVEITVRSPDGDVVAPGDDGEICVGPATSGPFAGCYTTMLGYWGHPERTREALRGGVLHTGDVGRMDADGVLWVLDRRSDLIVRGGANVYPAEVERVIESIPEIAEVAVVPRADERLGEEVVAVVLPAAGLTVDALDRDAMIAACASELARYKIPAAWFAVEQFPRNAMGKVVKPTLRQWLADGTWPDDLEPPTPIGV